MGVLWFNLSTRPRDGPVGATEVPPPVSWQQWSSNTVTVGPVFSPAASATSCCHWNSAPRPKEKLECLPPSVHSIWPVWTLTM